MASLRGRNYVRRDEYPAYMMSSILPCRRSSVRVRSAAFDASPSDSTSTGSDGVASSAHASPTWCENSLHDERDEPTHSHATFGNLLCSVIVLLIIALLVAPRDAEAAPVAWQRATATWYGPGFYGNTTACGQRYTIRLRGTAHMSLPCGARVTICRSARCVRVRVIDRGAFHPGNFDLSARTAMDLCRCQRPYTQRVRWHRGWKR
jgi:rare lipoprotein A (peptidoglycan hydrolase)